MKRIISVFLSVLLVFSLFITGNMSAFALGTPVWTKAFYPDVFGDPTDEYYLTNSKHFEGTYNNASVSSGDLYADIIVERDGGDALLYIVLYGNGTDQVKNGSPYDISYNIKVKKTDGSKFDTTGTLSSGSERIAVRSSVDLCVALFSSGEVSIYLEAAAQPINNYLFKAACGNFRELFEQEIITPYDEERYQEAMALLQDKMYDEAATAFAALGNYKDSAKRLEEAKSAFAKLMANVPKARLAIGVYHAVAVRSDGTVVATGSNSKNQCNIDDWSDIVAVAAESYLSLGLKADGTVITAGYNHDGMDKVSDWTDIVSIVTGSNHTVGLKSDGTVVATGKNPYGYFGQNDVSGWTNIIAVSGGTNHTVGLWADGTVIAVGDNRHGECKVSGWSDIVAVEAGGFNTFGLKSDGTVVAVGDNGVGQCDVGGWTDIVAIAAESRFTVGLKSDGTVVAVGDNNVGQCDVGSWTDIVAIATGEYSNGEYCTMGLRKDGTVVFAGADDDFRSDVSPFTDIKLPVANYAENSAGTDDVAEAQEPVNETVETAAVSETSYGEDVWHPVGDGKYQFRVYGFDPQDGSMEISIVNTETQQKYHGSNKIAETMEKGRAKGVTIETDYRVGEIEVVDGGFSFNVYLRLVKDGIPDDSEVALGFTVGSLDD